MTQNVQRSKKMGDVVIDALRAEVRRLVEQFGGQAELAKRFECSQGYISDFLNSNRGSGTKILIGLARLEPARFMDIVGSGNAPPSEVDPEVEKVARVILRKRGWTDAAIDAGRVKVTFLRAREAEDAVVVADAWEAPLLGAAGKPRALPEPVPVPHKRRSRSTPPAAK